MADTDLGYESKDTEGKPTGFFYLNGGQVTRNSNELRAQIKAAKGLFQREGSTWKLPYKTDEEKQAVEDLKVAWNVTNNAQKAQDNKAREDFLVKNENIFTGEIAGIQNRNFFVRAGAVQVRDPQGKFFGWNFTDLQGDNENGIAPASKRAAAARAILTQDLSTLRELFPEESFAKPIGTAIQDPNVEMVFEQRMREDGKSYRYYPLDADSNFGQGKVGSARVFALDPKLDTVEYLSRISDIEEMINTAKTKDLKEDLSDDKQIEDQIKKDVRGKEIFSFIFSEPLLKEVANLQGVNSFEELEKNNAENAKSISLANREYIRLVNNFEKMDELFQASKIGRDQINAAQEIITDSSATKDQARIARKTVKAYEAYQENPISADDIRIAENFVIRSDDGTIMRTLYQAADNSLGIKDVQATILDVTVMDVDKYLEAKATTDRGESREKENSTGAYSLDEEIAQLAKKLDVDKSLVKILSESIADQKIIAPDGHAPEIVAGPIVAYNKDYIVQAVITVENGAEDIKFLKIPRGGILSQEYNLRLADGYPQGEYRQDAINVLNESIASNSLINSLANKDLDDLIESKKYVMAGKYAGVFVVMDLDKVKSIYNGKEDKKVELSTKEASNADENDEKQEVKIYQKKDWNVLSRDQRRDVAAVQIANEIRFAENARGRSPAGEWLGYGLVNAIKNQEKQKHPKIPTHIEIDDLRNYLDSQAEVIKKSKQEVFEKAEPLLKEIAKKRKYTGEIKEKFLRPENPIIYGIPREVRGQVTFVESYNVEKDEKGKLQRGDADGVHYLLSSSTGTRGYQLQNFSGYVKAENVMTFGYVIDPQGVAKLTAIKGLWSSQAALENSYGKYKPNIDKEKAQRGYEKTYSSKDTYKKQSTPEIYSDLTKDRDAVANSDYKQNLNSFILKIQHLIATENNIDVSQIVESQRKTKPGYNDREGLSDSNIYVKSGASKGKNFVGSGFLIDDSKNIPWVNADVKGLDEKTGATILSMHEQGSKNIFLLVLENDSIRKYPILNSEKLSQSNTVITEPLQVGQKVQIQDLGLHGMGDQDFNIEIIDNEIAEIIKIQRIKEVAALRVQQAGFKSEAEKAMIKQMDKKGFEGVKRVEILPKTEKDGQRYEGTAVAMEIAGVRMIGIIKNNEYAEQGGKVEMRVFDDKDVVSQVFAEDKQKRDPNGVKDHSGDNIVIVYDGEKPKVLHMKSKQDIRLGMEDKIALEEMREEIRENKKVGRV